VRSGSRVDVFRSRSRAPLRRGAHQRRDLGAAGRLLSARGAVLPLPRVPDHARAARDLRRGAAPRPAGRGADRSGGARHRFDAAVEVAGARLHGRRARARGPVARRRERARRRPRPARDLLRLRLAGAGVAREHPRVHADRAPVAAAPRPAHVSAPMEARLHLLRVQPPDGERGPADHHLLLRAPVRLGGARRSPGLGPLPARRAPDRGGAGRGRPRPVLGPPLDAREPDPVEVPRRAPLPGRDGLALGLADALPRGCSRARRCSRRSTCWASPRAR